MGATVGVAVAFAVSLGLVMLFKPEWIPCSGKRRANRRNMNYYERHMDEF